MRGTPRSNSPATGILALALLLAAVPALASHPPEGLQQLAADYAAAATRGDLDAMVGAYTEGAVVLEPGRPPVEGRAAIREHLSRPEMAFPPGATATIETTDMVVDATGRHAAGRGTFTVTLPAQAGGGTQQSHWAAFFERVGDDWRVAWLMNLPPQDDPAEE